MSVQIKPMPASCEDAARLVAALDRELLERYPDTPIYGIDAENLESSGGLFVIAYVGHKPAACGAYRLLEGAVEIKRMYVAPEFRRRGLGRMILSFLEVQAAARGHTRAILETGKFQPEAIALYEAGGWTPTTPFGPYMGDPLSVYLGKALRPE